MTTAQLPRKPGQRIGWQNLHGSAVALAAAQTAQNHDGPVVIVAADPHHAYQVELEVRFFLPDATVPILPFPDWETLPYDTFSPHQDIVSQRLTTLTRLPHLRHGIIIVPVTTLMHVLPPPSFLGSHTFLLKVGDQLDLDTLRARFESAGYRCVSQVMEHGEFAIRGSLVDLFPMGSNVPYRIDLFDDEVESIRTFATETQRSMDKLDEIRLLPAREFSQTADAIRLFRQNFRVEFGGDPQRSPIYRDVSNNLAPGGIEYYLPLFFDKTSTFFDHVPSNSAVIVLPGARNAATAFNSDTLERYEQRRHDIERPLLNPQRLFLAPDALFAAFNDMLRVDVLRDGDSYGGHAQQFSTREPPALPINARASEPLAELTAFIDAAPDRRILIAAESAGRREALLELLGRHRIAISQYDSWAAFLGGDSRIGLTVAPLEQGLLLDDAQLAVISETQLFGEHAVQRRRRKTKERDPDSIIRDLSELNPGSPVVHAEHGIGRYLGLQTLTIDDIATEFLTLEYAEGNKLYVPVGSLHLINRYTGGAPETAPLHRLGSDQWSKAKERAAKRAVDVAAELLDTYARRAMRQGYAHPIPTLEYAAFASSFPFEETPDQANAIREVLGDLASEKPMDRLVCGDVGFGKTEVALRAAFVAAHNGFQVCVLVPTTLLAQQHYQNFLDRFADWPFRVEMISRFRSKTEQDVILGDLANGKVDIIVGTHKLIQPDVIFKNLGLVIIDEEHRFGVKQKEKLKALRSNVDILTLSATPIPRTLNMALSELRELSIIATPPSRRLAVKTFVQQWSDALIKEACLREIKRGGQVYFLHNDIDTIEKMATKISELVPEARVKVGHGQMSERDLERVMLDFYHQRFNVLVCTTIIETGIDVPSANTIVINRADRFGLAQLYQLRGRVGRSHHRAYAYLVVPPKKTLSKDAEKRLEALASIEELGAGFTLAIHDLEIRGAGEILGDDQSGQIHEVGFSLFSEMLERAVRSLKRGETPKLDEPLETVTDIDLGIPTLIPEDYLPDVHSRLVLYKRIASASDENGLRELQVEMIDRFGLLPPAAKNLFLVAELRLEAKQMGIEKIDGGPKGLRFIFNDKPNVNPAKIIRLIQMRPKQYKMDGQTKLRFIDDLVDAQSRLEAVREVMSSIAM